MLTPGEEINAAREAAKVAAATLSPDPSPHPNPDPVPNPNPNPNPNPKPNPDPDPDPSPNPNPNPNQVAAAAAAAAEAIAEGRKPADPAGEPRKRKGPFQRNPPSRAPPLPSAGEKGTFLLKMDNKVLTLALALALP